MLRKCSKFGKLINSKIKFTKKWMKFGDCLITVQFRVFYCSAPIWQRNDCIIMTCSFTCCLVYVSIIVFTAVRTPDLIDLGCMRIVIGYNLYT